MRKFILWIYCIFGLTSCAHYGDIHNHSKPLTISDLNAKNTYVFLNKNQQHSNWWDQFNDPNLNQLILISLHHSPNIKIAQARVRRASAVVEARGGLLWPSIDFNGYIERERFSKFGLAPPPFNGRIFNIGNLAFNLNYNLDFWGRNRQILASRISEKCALEADLAESRLIISSAVASTYFQLLNVIEQIKMAEKNVRIAQDISKIVVYRASRGIDSDVPVKIALASTQSAKLIVEQFKESEVILKNQLAILMGKNPFNMEVLTRRFIYQKHVVHLPKNLTANLLAARPDILAAKLRASAAAHQVEAAKTRFYPDISLQALFSYQSVIIDRLFDGGSQNNAIGAAVDLPIFDAGIRRANLKVKYAEFDLAVNEYNKTILNALREVSDQLAKLHSLDAQLFVQEQELNATMHHYKLFNSRYNHGIIDYVQVLEVKQLLLQQQAQQINLQSRHLQAFVAMLVALGGNETSKRA